MIANRQLTKKQNMSAATFIRSTGFIGADPESVEATSRTSARLAPEALTLETKHLSRTVVERVLVSDITVQVQPGEVLAVAGPSGAGKSSFLRLLNRLDEPTGGTVRLNDQDYRELAPRELRRRVGMVMQVAYLFRGTVAANVVRAAAAR
jgi:ABC-type multidrug transport system fused ATPase/permease subunit